MTDRAAEQEAKWEFVVWSEEGRDGYSVCLHRGPLDSADHICIGYQPTKACAEKHVAEGNAWLQRRDVELARLNVGMDAYALQAEKQHARIHELTEPIPLLLFCPRCAAQHMDAPQPEKGWTNPPHRSHECQGCGYVWRPADVPTIGVETITTSGERDQSATPALKAQHEAALAQVREYSSEVSDLKDQIDILGEAVASDHARLTEAQREIERLTQEVRGFQNECHRLLVCDLDWRTRMAQIAEAARIDRPDEDKHQVCVRILKLATPPAPASKGELCPKCKGTHAAIGLCPRAHVTEPGTPAPAGGE